MGDVLGGEKAVKSQGTVSGVREENCSTELGMLKKGVVSMMSWGKKKKEEENQLVRNRERKNPTQTRRGGEPCNQGAGRTLKHRKRKNKLSRKASNRHEPCPNEAVKKKN